MRIFISGMLTLGYAVAATFFARFWRDSRDRLFLFFAVAFALLSLHRIGLAAADHLPFPQTAHYVVRLLAYLTILAAIVDRNRR
jgi:hypothetical protein